MKESGNQTNYEKRMKISVNPKMVMGGPHKEYVFYLLLNHETLGKDTALFFDTVTEELHSVHFTQEDGVTPLKLYETPDDTGFHRDGKQVIMNTDWENERISEMLSGIGTESYDEVVKDFKASFKPVKSRIDPERQEAEFWIELPELTKETTFWMYFQEVH